MKDLQYYPGYRGSARRLQEDSAVASIVTEYRRQPWGRGLKIRNDYRAIPVSGSGEGLPEGVQAGSERAKPWPRVYVFRGCAGMNSASQPRDLWKRAYGSVGVQNIIAVPFGLQIAPLGFATSPLTTMSAGGVGFPSLVRAQ
jgi:hypothetical protein